MVLRELIALKHGTRTARTEQEMVVPGGSFDCEQRSPSLASGVLCGLTVRLACEGVVVYEHCLKRSQ